MARSEGFEHSNWTKTNISVSQDSIVAPNGLMTADLLQSVATSSSNVFASVVATAANVTYSIYTKKGNVSTRFFLLRNSTTATNFQLGTINYDTATISGSGWTIQALPSGWYRIAFTQSTGITSGDTLLAYCGMKGDTDTAGSTWSVWGAQIEAGTFPTSYIPTAATVPVVRSPDVCSITGTDFSGFYNQSEGTIFISAEKTGTTNSTGSYLSFAGGGFEPGPLIARAPTQLTGRIRNNSGLDLTNLDFIESPLGIKKIAASWVADSNNTNRAFASDGAIRTSTNPNAGVAANNQTSMTIGARPLSVSVFNGHIASLRYYQKRLSNAKLQSLTAP